MPSRSAKCSFPTSGAPSKRSRQAAGLAALWAALLGPVALASMSVVVNVGQQNYGSMSGTTIYYSTVPAASPNNPIFYDNNFAQVPPSAHYAGDSSNNTSAPLQGAQVIQVSSNLSSIPAPSSGQVTFLALQYMPAGNPVNAYLPILGYTVLGSGISTCQNGAPGQIQGPCSFLGIPGNMEVVTGDPVPVGNLPGGNRYFGGAPYSALETVNLYLYPGDTCTALIAQGQQSTLSGVCAIPSPTASGVPTSGVGVTPGAGISAQIPFRVVLISAPNDYQTAPGSATTTVDNSGEFILSYQADVNPESCPGPDASSAIYPGDGQIQVNTSLFGLLPALGSQDAPAQSLLVLTAPSPTPPVPTANYGGPPTGQELALTGTSQYAVGFQDSSGAPGTAGSIPYSMLFLVRDATGMVVGPSAATGSTCTATGYAYHIFGFLNANHCFIATAAFRDLNPAPVVMLRKFRDVVLLHHSWGRSFVRFYYRWSPPMAEWLVMNPTFRYPVLLLLAPLELIAWCALHPLAGLLLFAGALATLLVGAVAALRARRREAGSG